MSVINREELDAVRNHISNIPAIGAMYAPVLVEHCRALLAEVERLTAERDASHRDGMDRMQQAIIDLLQAHNAPAGLIARIVEMEYP